MRLGVIHIDANDSVGKNARIFDEVIEAQTYLAAVTAFDANFDRYRVVDARVKAALTDPIPVAAEECTWICLTKSS